MKKIVVVVVFSLFAVSGLAAGRTVHRARSKTTADAPVVYSADGSYLVGMNFRNVFSETEVVTLEQRIGGEGAPVVLSQLSVAGMTHRECEAKDKDGNVLPPIPTLEIRARLTQAQMKGGIQARISNTAATSPAVCMALYEVPKP